MNIVEMKSDSIGGNSQPIRITCWFQQSIFPKGTVYPGAAFIHEAKDLVLFSPRPDKGRTTPDID